MSGVSPSSGPALPRWLARVVAVAVLMGAAVLVTAATASAHAALLLTDPADGARLAAPPSSVTLMFNQPVLGIGAVMEVVGPGGNVGEGAPRLVDREVQQALRANAPDGSYRVEWRVTSIDGHVISGTFGYTVGSGPRPASAPASASSGGIPVIVWALIGAGLLVVMTGIVLAARHTGPTRARDDELV
jgi:methionine-rich copper-binding protein CopC